MSYNNYNWQKLASDYNSPLFRNIIWVQGFLNMHSEFNVSKPIFGIISHKNNIDYIGDINSWMNIHKELKRRVEDDYHYLEWLIDNSLQYGITLNKWTFKNIWQYDLYKLSNKRLYNLYKEFKDKIEGLLARGMTVPVLDFQSFSFVENNLTNLLEKKVPINKQSDYYTLFTEPIKNSFAQEQEKALLNLIIKYNSIKWRKDILHKNIDISNIKEKYHNFYNDLQKHTNKYAWVYYTYVGPAYTEINFLEFIREILIFKQSPKNKLQNIKQREKDIKLKQKQYLQNIKFNNFEKFILKIAGKVVWGKPRRKDLESKSFYHVEKLQREIAKRLYLSLNQVRNMTLKMLEDFLVSGKKVNFNKINDLYDIHVCLPNIRGKVKVIYGKEAKYFIKNKVTYPKVKIDANKKELKGVTAFAGIIKGIIRIVNRPVDMKKMHRGDVLVSTATTPSIVPAMKKAGAIVTDEGGLTCHAAIVSRELNIPCVIGTKVATKVLHDGMQVEVDAYKGLIKIIK